MAAVKRKKFYIHLVSDATGTTLLGLSRAVLAQFSGIDPIQKFWPLVRNERQLERVIRRIAENPGPVIFTLVCDDMRNRLTSHCEMLGVPCISVLDPIIHSLSSYLGVHAAGVPGLQHAMDDAYFKRVSAMDFALRYDDGQHYDGLEKAEVILIGVSRTSKTPTSIYLARRGIKTANIPLVPDVDIPDKCLSYKGPLYVGLTSTPDRLRVLRNSRLKSGDNGKADKIYNENAYLDEEKIETEIKKARRMFSEHGWPVIDVTKRSIEETSAEIMALLQSKREKEAGLGKGKRKNESFS